MNLLKKLEGFHPLQTFIYLAFVAIIVLFIGFIIPFTIALNSSPHKQVLIPKTFFISTFIILLSEYSLKKALSFYKQDQLTLLFRWLLTGLVLVLIFSFLQIIGWHYLDKQNISVKQGITNPKVYLYLLSGLHLLHVLGGLFFYLALLYKTLQAINNQVKQIIFLSEKIEALRLKLLAEYWRLLAILWIVIFIYFLIMFN
jgi:cytochrome c oxidase subunit 3